MMRIFAEYDVESQVQFKGYVAKKNLMNELHEADILLYPGYHHGLATLILQAMYAFLPIVSMQGDIISEVVDQQCGLAVGGQTKEEIIVALIGTTTQLIDDQELRLKFAMKGRNMIEETYAWNKLIEQMNEVYQSTLKQPNINN